MPEQQQATENNRQKPPESQNPKLLWDTIFPDTISFFTFWLSLFTAALALVAFLQLSSLNRAERISANIAQAAKDSAEVARQSLVTVQRAFVFIDSFEANIMHNDLMVAPKWRNSGTTPTRFMSIWTNWKPFSSEPPDDFSFPDLGEDGNPVDEKNKKLIRSFVGPNGTTFAQVSIIPKAILDEMRAGHIRVFVWGWAKYQDVFYAYHTTKFCNEIKIIATWSEGEKAVGAFTFPLYRRHNCTDDECDGEK